MKRRRSLYARPEIIRGQQCAEAPLDPGGATKQLPARRYLALEGGLTAEPAGLSSAAGAVHKNPVGRPSVRSLGVVVQEGPDAGRAVVTLSTSLASVRCPVSGASDQCPRLLSTGPVSSVRAGVCASRCPLSGVRCGRPVSVRCRVRCVRPKKGPGARRWGRQPYGWDGRGRRGRRLRPCPARGLLESAPRLDAGAGACWASRASIWTWPSSWEVVGQCQLDRVADQDRPGARQDSSLVGAGARARLAFCGRLIGMRRANRSAGLAG